MQFERPVIGLEPAPVEYAMYRARYDALAKSLEAEGFRTRLASRRVAYRAVGSAALMDLVIRVDRDTLAIVDVDGLIERVQQALSTEPLPPEPRIGKILVDDGTEHVFPLDEADIP